MNKKLSLLISENDYKIELLTTVNLTNTPNRNKIEQALQENGFAMPLPRNVQFYLGDSNGKVFSMTYFKGIDKFGYEKLTLK